MPAALTALILLGGIDVDGDSTCPSPYEVRARLEAGGISGPSRSVHRVTLSASPTGLTVRLTDAAGSILAERALPVAACASLAQAVLALVGTWEATLVMPPAPEVATPPPPASPKRRPWAIGISVDAAASSGGFSLGALGFASLTFSERGPGFDVWFGALGPHDIPTTAFGLPDVGNVSWQRFPLGLGAHWRLVADPVHVDVHAEGLIALLGFELPAGFLPRSPFLTEDQAVGGGARLEAPLGPILVWFGLSLVYWPGLKTLNVMGGSQAQTLPRIEVLVQQGIAFGRDL